MYIYIVLRLLKPIFSKKTFKLSYTELNTDQCTLTMCIVEAQNFNFKNSHACHVRKMPFFCWRTLLCRISVISLIWNIFLVLF